YINPALNRIWSIRAVDGLGRAVPITQEAFDGALIDWTITPDDPRYMLLERCVLGLFSIYKINIGRDLHLIFDVQYQTEWRTLIHIYLRNGTWIVFGYDPRTFTVFHIGCEPERKKA